MIECAADSNGETPMPRRNHRRAVPQASKVQRAFGFLDKRSVVPHRRGRTSVRLVRQNHALGAMLEDAFETGIIGRIARLHNPDANSRLLGA